jgi:putative NIF3 family GTP cyclohydrolase 1 type 2
LLDKTPRARATPLELQLFKVGKYWKARVGQRAPHVSLGPRTATSVEPKDGISCGHGGLALHQCRRQFYAQAVSKQLPVESILLTATFSYPEILADNSFDNTGLLLEAPFDPLRRQMNSVLLTVDLTRAVTDEAIEHNHSVVVSYHPIIFRGLKSLTLADSQQLSLLRLALQGISVYCPHTAVDAVPDGMADWLCDIVSGKLSNPEPETHTATSDKAPMLEAHEKKSQAKPEDTKIQGDKAVGRPSAYSQRSYSKPTYPLPISLSETDLYASSVPHKRSVIHPSPAAALDTANANAPPKSNPTYTSSNTGAGRLITFNSPQPLTHLIERIARGVGTPKGFPVAIPQSSSVEDIQIRTVGVCPGSGEFRVLGNNSLGNFE